MDDYYFLYNKKIFMFNARLLKLFRVEDKKLIEIFDPKILHEIRFNSIEVEREQPYRLTNNGGE